RRRPTFKKPLHSGPTTSPIWHRGSTSPARKWTRRTSGRTRPADFKKIMLSYYDAISDSASHVLRAMATSLGVSDAYFTDKFDRQASVVRIIRYPAVTQPPLPGQLRAGIHTDYGIMTFVRGDDTPGGLQVRHRQGGWIDVHIPSDAFCCNIGDLMARWSNDRWVSTLHRVAVPPPDAVLASRLSSFRTQIPTRSFAASRVAWERARRRNIRPSLLPSTTSAN